ncbi:hypothetical protein ACIQ6V_02460 [Streptomyces sp. NPDC096198]|uniref:hypothetical protein n=1 Tax=Streptomyces sp. NPDC096198 TaxID=3366080 RepID=UPI00381EA0A5
MLLPVGRVLVLVLKGVGYVLAFAVGGALAVVALPGRWLYRRVVKPVGRGVVRLVLGLAAVVLTVAVRCGAVLVLLVRYLAVVPASVVWRRVLVPVGRLLLVVGREVGAALGHAWRVAGHVSLAVGRFLKALFRWFFVAPGRWVYRTVLTPVGHLVRAVVLRPAAEAARGVGRAVRQTLAVARETARQARADLRRMLLGAAPQPQPGPSRELGEGRARTLGSSTTALTED